LQRAVSACCDYSVFTYGDPEWTESVFESVERFDVDFPEDQSETFIFRNS
jgi:hypothetical protein